VSLAPPVLSSPFILEAVTNGSIACQEYRYDIAQTLPNSSQRWSFEQAYHRDGFFDIKDPP
jgi:hypothetical protein